MNCADISCVCHFCTSPNKIPFQLLMARFVLRNMHNVCCLTIWLPLYYHQSLTNKKQFSIFTFEASFVQADAFYRFRFCHWHPYSKWECCPLVTNSIRCKVQWQLTICKLLKNISATKILSDAPQTGSTNITILNEQMVYTYLACTNIFTLHARTCKNMDWKGVFHVKVNPCRFPRNKPSQLTTNLSSVHHHCWIVTSYQLS